MKQKCSSLTTVKCKQKRWPFTYCFLIMLCHAWHRFGVDLPGALGDEMTDTPTERLESCGLCVLVEMPHSTPEPLICCTPLDGGPDYCRVDAESLCLPHHPTHCSDSQPSSEEHILIRPQCLAHLIRHSIRLELIHFLFYSHPAAPSLLQMQGPLPGNSFHSIQQSDGT